MPRSPSRSPPPRDRNREHRYKDKDSRDYRDDNRYKRDRSRSPPRYKNKENDFRYKEDNRYRRDDERSDNRRVGRRGSRERERERPPNSPGRPSLALKSRSPLPDQEGGKLDKPVSLEPDFKPSGALAAETNTLNGVLLKYNEPPEARKPIAKWRLYVFKGNDQTQLFHISSQSAYLLGRDKTVVDIPLEHPSASKQHAVIQFRQVHEKNEFGDQKVLVKPFLIDLDSSNGTFVNGDEIPKSRYYELLVNDVLKFASSTREYVLLIEE